MKKIAYLALLLGAAPMAAFAGGTAQPIIEPVLEMPAPVAVMAPNVDWTGAYAGASLGYGNLKLSGRAANSHEGIAGVNLGYRHDFGSMVLGGELSYSKNDIGINGADNQINSTLAAQVMFGADMGRTLVYVAGGVAQANAKLLGKTGTDNGFFGGVGLDYLLTDTWTVGGEITASRYKNFDNSGINLSDTSLQVKVGYRF